MDKANAIVVTESDINFAKQIAWQTAKKLGKLSIGDELESLCCCSLPGIIAKVKSDVTRQAYIRRSLKGYCLNYARSLGSRQLQDIASAYRKLVKSRPNCISLKKAAEVLACTESLLAEALQHTSPKQIHENSSIAAMDSYEQAQLSIIKAKIGDEAYFNLLEAIENGEDVYDRIEEIRVLLCYNN